MGCAINVTVMPDRRIGPAAKNEAGAARRPRRASWLKGNGSSGGHALIDAAVGGQIRPVGGDRVVRIDAEIAVQDRRLAGIAEGEQADAVARVAGDDVAADQVDDLRRAGAAADQAVEAIAGRAD